MSEHNPKDLVRIVYHAENRTFARLFNERSLEDVKNVVRRKLGLGQETNVFLKQMGADKLLDLDDDDDFQAFCVLVKSAASVDIQVTVGSSLGPLPPPSDEQRGEEQPSGRAGTTLVASSSAVQRVRSEAEYELSGGPTEAVRTPGIVSAATKTPGASARKRKVSFSHAALSASKKPAAVMPVATPVPAEERPKKKRKPTKEPATPIVESPSVKDGAAPKRKTRKSAASDGGNMGETTPAVENPPANAVVAPDPKPKKSVASSEAGPSEPRSTEPPVIKLKRQRKDGSDGTKKSSAPDDQEGTSQPTDPTNDSTIIRSVGKARKPSAEAGVSKTRKSEKTKSTPKFPGVCAAIPQTNESTSVQSEVAAAILSGLFKPSETVPHQPLAKEKTVRKTRKKSLPASNATVSDVAANEVPNTATDHSLERAVPTDPPPQRTRESNGPPCPICLEEPFHIRYRCPIVLKGPNAIQERLEQLKEINPDDQLQVIKELEGLLRDSQATSRPSLDAVLTGSTQTRDGPRSHDVSLPGTPNIPSNSQVSEVTVESRDEGSSSESSDDVLESIFEPKDLSTSQRHPSLANHDMEAVVRPVPKQSIQHFFDVFLKGPQDEESGSDSSDVEAELEEDTEDGADRFRRRLSRHAKHSFVSESEEEESRSPSRSEEIVSNDLKLSVERQQDDVVIRDFVDPHIPERQGGDSSEETHVASEEDRMVVDGEFIGEKDVNPIVGQQAPSTAPGVTTLPPSDSSDALRGEQQGPKESEVDPPSNREASDVPREVEADPIEPVDDLEPLTVLLSSTADPIETPSEDVGSLFTGAAQSTPKPGVTKRIKTRHGRVLEDGTDHPVLVEQLDLEAVDVVTPLPPKTRLRQKLAELSAGQEPPTSTTSLRRSVRSSSVPPLMTTPAAVAIMNHQKKTGTRAGRATKTPAKRSERSVEVSQTEAQFGNTPSLVRWETLAEPSSPSVVPEEPCVLLDELMSSPHPDSVPVRGHPKKATAKTRGKGKGKEQPRNAIAPVNNQESSQGKERLFDLTASQIPFPYSQHQNLNLNNGSQADSALAEETTDTEEEGSKMVKKKTKVPVKYRSLSQLASEAVLHSPDLPTPATRMSTDGKTKKRAAEESSSSSSSDEEEANGSQHIPRGQRAGSTLGTKRKSLLSRI